ncbi:cytochrome c [Roseimicrobium gellanilyticum]|uniref:Cytochrome c n=1 Tax=Roseimicrobium gellanilyticum TaxID=748857 RepID=A0A366HUH7_9BACT|nr:c-type cytochrome domain-containing protein [Roseimicrobium gellanilyticum]RBP47329.1 cytochrome c [Roseimicrobium gellanilyticum]
MNKLLLTALALAPASFSFAADFASQVVPVLKQHCYKCHSEAEKKEKGDLVLDNLKRLGEGVGAGKMIIPGNPDGSSFFTCLTSPADDSDHMPPEKMMPDKDIAIIKSWIAAGASFTKGGTAPVAAPTAPAAPAAPAAAMTTWTSADGRTIQAKKLRLEGENVILERADGQVFTLPISKLSPESQAAAKAP